MELHDATSQMSVGINIIVTMFSCFVVGWYLGGKFFDDDVLVSGRMIYIKEDDEWNGSVVNVFI